MEIAGDQVRGVNEWFDATKNHQTQHPQPKSVDATPPQPDIANQSTLGKDVSTKSPSHQSGGPPRLFSLESL